MPISPNEASRDNFKAHKKEIEKSIAYIDKTLKEKFRGDNTVKVYLDAPDRRVVTEIQNEYARVGWHVSFSREPGRPGEDNSSFTFSPKKLGEPRYRHSTSQLEAGGH